MGYPLRVLIVQDSKSDTETLVAEMCLGGYLPDYQQVNSFIQLSSLLPGGNWDLILTDYRLKSFSVLDLLKLRNLFGLDVPVFVVSGSSGEEAVVASMHAGAHDFILKNNLERLNPAIEREMIEMQVHREHSQARVDLKESEQRFRQLTEAIRGVYWLIDAKTSEFIYLSPAYSELWERPSEELVKNPLSLLDSVHPEDYSRIEGKLKQSWAKFNAEYRIILPDDTTRWVSTKTFPITDKDGEVYRLAALTFDITARKVMEADMKNLTRALEQTADMVLITDLQGRIVYVNAAFEDVTGYGRDELLGNSPSMLKSGLQDERFYRAMWQNLTNGLPYTDIFINRRKDGEIFYHEQTITPVKNEKGDVTHFVATGKDITARLRAQERLHQIVHYDAVTGLANKILLFDRLAQAIKHARRMQEQVGVLCFGFSIGELLGDSGSKKIEEQLLREIAHRLKGAADEHTTVAQLSNEQFAILHQNVRETSEFNDYAQHILDVFATPIVAEGYELFLTPSIGVSLFPEDGDNMEELLKQAELAMCYARQQPGEDYYFYNEKMDPERARTGLI